MSQSRLLSRPYFYYAVALCAAGLITLLFVELRLSADIPLQPVLTGFALLFCLFTISVGFPHPNFGHVSFDRVGQIATILILGPFTAAAVSGAASFLYPIYRLARGVSLEDVTIACLHNAGLMIFVVLGGGLFYQFIGGDIPITGLSLLLLGKLAAVLLLMQLINEFGMGLYLFFRGGNPMQVINLFSTSVELCSGFMGVLVALGYMLLETGPFVLLLAVLAIGMFVLRRFATMRGQLEALVKKRTRELELKSEELERKATHDKLTNLYNRRYADDYLERELEEANRYQTSFTIALVDIDHFKQVNDCHSHEVGDIVLQQVARILKETCRSSDTIARYGGEEFLLCFPQTDVGSAKQLCEKLRHEIETYNWALIRSTVSVTASFGVAQIDVNSRRKTILREADERLYAAKNLGRNRVVA